MIRAAAFAPLVAALVLAGCAGSSGSSSSSAGSDLGQQSATTPTTAAAAGTARRRHHHRAAHAASQSCPSASRALDGVYHPDRLQLLAPCKKAAGKIDLVRHEQDGDLHIDVALDPQYASLTDSANDSQQHGDLVVEFMARDGGHLPEPSVGDTISLVGAWVDDTQHGWDELHPVWSVRLDGGARSTSGPQFGGSPSADRSYDAAADCRTPAGPPCAGYGGVPSSAPARHHVSAPPPTAAPPSTADFCATRRCIPSFNDGAGYIVQCNDGEWSHSGGRPGACSSHNGESGRTYP